MEFRPWKVERGCGNAMSWHKAQKATKDLDLESILKNAKKVKECGLDDLHKKVISNP